MKQVIKHKLLLIPLAVVALAVYYYIFLPAVNIHSPGLWKFIIAIPAILLVIYLLPKLDVDITAKHSKGKVLQMNWGLIRNNFRAKLLLCITLILIAIYLIGSALSSPVINASKYQKLLTVENREFSEDITQISYKQIPLLDKSSAQILGNRKMGSLVDLASQFEVADLYTQINYQDTPVRVTPLQYANIIKWFTNKGNGIPAYIKIDMATQKTELIRLQEGMKYTPYDHFNRNLYRHLRFRYPTYIFDDISFEIDEEGTPYWVCSVKKYTIGLFGGQTIGNVVLCNAITGECQNYDVAEAPTWIDRVYSADLLTSLYRYYGSLKHGFINSILSQRDCLTTTNGYNYLALEDDVWVYTGVTSITSDQSNVGFVLMNQRTMETRYYEIEGAIEDSAMSSAEGKVQNLGYWAAFPLLLNIDNEPTYFMVLKDDSGLVKKYAMVNVHNYQIVATGDSVSECEVAYRKLMSENGIQVSKEPVVEVDTEEITGKIAKIVPSVVDGDSHYYVLLEGSDEIFDVNITEQIDIILCEVGDTVTLHYTRESDRCPVVKVTR